MKSRKRKKIPLWKKLLATALAAATVTGGTIAVSNLPYFVGEKVIIVRDGDTFVISNNQPIRLYYTHPVCGYPLSTFISHFITRRG